MEDGRKRKLQADEFFGPDAKRTTHGRADHMFDGMSVCVCLLLDNYSALCGMITRHGGALSYSIGAKTTHLVTTAAEASFGTYAVQEARTRTLPVVSANFVLDSVAAGVRLAETAYLLPDATGNVTLPLLLDACDAATPAAEISSPAPSPDYAPEVPVVAHPHKEWRPHWGLAKIYAEGDAAAPYFPAEYEVVRRDVLNAAAVSGTNKFYSLEIHHGRENGKDYHRVYTHYGSTDRQATGSGGTRHCRYVNSLEQATWLYDLIKEDKSDPVRKGYMKVSLAAPSVGSSAARVLSDPSDAPGTEGDGAPEMLEPLDPAVASLVDRIYADAEHHLTSAVAVTVTERGIETPLGVLAESQVRAGFNVLAELREDLAGGGNNVARLSNQFYSLIPHKSSAAGTLGPLATCETVAEKEELLQLMLDILHVRKVQSGPIDPLAVKYRALRCSITAIAPGTSDYLTALRVLKLPPRATGKTPEVVSIFRVQRNDEQRAFASTSDRVGGVKLLLHGSRAGNWLGILSRGVLLPTTVQSLGVARTDYGLLGAGIYFSDALSTSAKYTTPGGAGTRLLAVASVALGSKKNFTSPQPGLTKPPGPYHSCCGVASTRGLTTAFCAAEYVVYRTDQQQLEYLVEFRLPDDEGISQAAAVPEASLSTPPNATAAYSKKVPLRFASPSGPLSSPMSSTPRAFATPTVRPAPTIVGARPALPSPLSTPSASALTSTAAVTPTSSWWSGFSQGRSPYAGGYIPPLSPPPSTRPLFAPAPQLSSTPPVATVAKEEDSDPFWPSSPTPVAAPCTLSPAISAERADSNVDDLDVDILAMVATPAVASARDVPKASFVTKTMEIIRPSPAKTPAVPAFKASAVVRRQTAPADCKPIKAIHPYSSEWAIEVLVTYKSEMYHYKNARSSGNFFYVDLMDSAGSEIRAVGYGDIANSLFARLRLDSLVVVSNAALRVANRKYSKIKCDYEISFDHRTRVQELPPDPTFPRPAVRHVALERIAAGQCDLETPVDVLAVVIKVGALGEITAKSTGNKIPLRKLTLDDGTGTVALSTWYKLAQECEYEVGDVLDIRRIDLYEYGGTVSLSTKHASFHILRNPASPAADALRARMGHVAKPVAAVRSVAMAEVVPPVSFPAAVAASATAMEVAVPVRAKPTKAGAFTAPVFRTAIRPNSGWDELVTEECSKPYFADVCSVLSADVAGGAAVLPPVSRVFAAFNACPFDRVRVVIVGQDPYHTPGVATGMAFAVAHGQPIPPSLQTIFQEINEDAEVKGAWRGGGDLSSWAAQGVLLLNAALTVRQGEPASHSHLWLPFTEAVFAALNTKSTKLVFMLWGSKAARFAPFIDTTRHCVLSAPHPSPLAQRGADTRFSGCRHFSIANRILMGSGQEPIDWTAQLVPTGAVTIAKTTTRQREGVPGWSVEQVSEWIEASDFREYAGAFVAQGVTGAVLVSLTSAELRDDIGIATLGRRKELLAAIAAMAGTGPGSESASKPPPAPDPKVLAACLLTIPADARPNFLAHVRDRAGEAAVSSTLCHVPRKALDGLRETRDLPEGVDIVAAFNEERSFTSATDRSGRSIAVDLFEAPETWRHRPLTSFEDALPVIICPPETDLAPVSSMWEFRRLFRDLTHSRLDGLDWNNMVVAGGSILSCLYRTTGLSAWDSADIDIFLYDLTRTEATEKIHEIYRHLCRASHDRVGAVRTKNAVTFFSSYPQRHIQVITQIFDTRDSITARFDLDCCSVAFDNKAVFALPRAVRALATRTNIYLAESLRAHNPRSHQGRAVKYALRGFGLRLMGGDLQPTVVDAVCSAKMLSLSFKAEEAFTKVHEPPMRRRRKKKRGSCAAADAGCGAAEGGEEGDLYEDAYVPFGPEWTYQKIQTRLEQRRKNAPRSFYICGNAEDVLESLYGPGL